MSRNIQFPSILRTLVEDKKINRNSASFFSAVGISFSALAQYMNGTLTPRFKVLVALAEYFEVSLDYLIFGLGPVDSKQHDDKPALRYVDLALDSLQKRNAWHFHLYRRIVAMLGEEIGELISKTASEAATVMAGNTMDCILNRPETIVLEGFSTRAWIATRSFELDVRVKEEGLAEGPFFDTVVSNVKQGCSYCFLLPQDPQNKNPWGPVIRGFEELLVKRIGGRDCLVQFEFKQTSNFPITGFSIHRLDVNQLKSMRADLYAQLSASNSIKDDCIGYLAPPIEEATIGMLMDMEHLSYSHAYFEKVWRAADKIRAR